MALATFPSVSSPVKSVQRGSAAGAGNVTITAIDISKSFVNIFGTTSSGTVAATGAVGAATGTLGGNAAASTFQMRTRGYSGNQSTYGINATGSVMTGNLDARTLAGNLSVNASNITGGTNNLVAAVVQGFLANSTTLTVSGACRWEVVEFN